MIPRLAILASHPVQYQAPLFRELERQAPGRCIVYFCSTGSAQEQARAGYGKPFEWDVDLLGGFRHRVLENVARKPDIHGFSGLDTPEIEKHLRADRIDALVLFGWHFKAAIQGALAARALGVALLVRSDSILDSPRRSPWVQAVKRCLYPALLRRVDVCLPVGQRSSDYFKAYGVPEAKIAVVPHTVDERLFLLDEGARLASRERIRRELGIGADAFVALFVGRLVPVKRPLDFVCAVGAARIRDMAGLIVGGGELEAECRECEGPISRVRHLGFRNQTELPAIYAAADVVVVPSEGETWCLVVNEAMAAGTPCVVSDSVGSAGDLVVPGRTGEVFPRGSVGALSGILEALAADKSRCSQLGHAAQAEIRRRSGAASAAAMFEAARVATRSSQ